MMAPPGIPNRQAANRHDPSPGRTTRQLRLDMACRRTTPECPCRASREPYGYRYRQTMPGNTLTPSTPPTGPSNEPLETLPAHLLRQRQTQRRLAPATMWPNKRTPLPMRLNPTPRPNSQRRQMRHVAFSNTTSVPHMPFHMRHIQRTAFHRLRGLQSLQRPFRPQSHSGHMPQHMQSIRCTVEVAQESACSTLL